MPDPTPPTPDTPDAMEKVVQEAIEEWATIHGGPRPFPDEVSLGAERLFTFPVQGVESDERFTPRWIFDGLGLEFDLDPASPLDGGDCVPARQKLTRLEDGLAQPWQGRVWLNPPFSAATAWAERFAEHGHGIFLGPVANARWWFDLARRSDLIWHCRDFAFTHPSHAGRRSSMPLAMMSMGEECGVALRKLANSGRHAGVLVSRA